MCAVVTCQVQDRAHWNPGLWNPWICSHQKVKDTSHLGHLLQKKWQVREDETFKNGVGKAVREMHQRQWVHGMLETNKQTNREVGSLVTKDNPPPGSSLPFWSCNKKKVSMAVWRWMDFQAWGWLRILLIEADNAWDCRYGVRLRSFSF